MPYCTVIESVPYSHVLPISSFDFPDITIHVAAYDHAWQILYQNGSVCVRIRSYLFLLHPLLIIVFITHYYWSISTHITDYVIYITRCTSRLFLLVMYLESCPRCPNTTSASTDVYVHRTTGTVSGIHVYPACFHDHSHRNSCRIPYQVITFKCNSLHTLHENRTKQKH